MTKSHLFYSAERLLTLIERNKKMKRISDITILAENEITGHTEKEIIANAIDRVKIMKKSVKSGMKLKESKSGMVKDDAKKLNKMINNDKMLQSPLMLKAASYGLAVMSNNAMMGTIVAAPTAGSSGILPGCLIALQENLKLTDEQVARGLLTAAGIGMIIAHISTFSAAKAGCQAEIGASAAMTAAAISEIRGMTPKACIHAAAMTLKNTLGLACDPIAGLVEVPCVKRNAIGISMAMTASDMAYAGIESIVPFDEVVEAMNNVAKNMSPAIRETSMGGLAISKTAKKYEKELLKIN
jgi:L-serine dehydratase